MASTHEEARRLLDTPMGRYTALSETSALWSRHGRKHPLGDDFRGFVDILTEDFDRRVLDDALSSTTLDMMLDAAYVGSPETLARRFRECGALVFDICRSCRCRRRPRGAIFSTSRAVCGGS
jgi:phthiodiolone/phenolphthiodiolone dimycocerosates ketoreductase